MFALGGAAEGVELPLAPVGPLGLQPHDVVARPHDDLGLAVAQRVAVGHRGAPDGVARVDDRGLFHVGRDRQAHRARGQRLQIALDLLALFGRDAGRRAQIARVSVERLAIAFEADGAETDVAENFGRFGDFVRPLELNISLFDTLAVRVLQVIDAGAKVLTRLVRDLLGPGPGGGEADEGGECGRQEPVAAEVAAGVAGEGACHRRRILPAKPLRSPTFSYDPREPNQRELAPPSARTTRPPGGCRSACYFHFRPSNSTF